MKGYKGYSYIIKGDNTDSVYNKLKEFMDNHADYVFVNGNPKFQIYTKPKKDNKLTKFLRLFDSVFYGEVTESGGDLILRGDFSYHWSNKYTAGILSKVWFYVLLTILLCLFWIPLGLLLLTFIADNRVICDLSFIIFAILGIFGCIFIEDPFKKQKDIVGFIEECYDLPE